MSRVIFHVDVNSAFLSWSAAYRVRVLGEREDLRGIPSAVAGERAERHGIILAKSIPAKKCGVKTGEQIFLAQQKCPGLKLVPPDYALYVQASRRFIALLREFAPVVEQYSIDEAWADLSGTEGLYGSPAAAAELLRAGRSFEEVGDRILTRRPHMCQFFTVDDLNYLKRGGRISGAAALVGSVLGIKPILRGDETGHIVSCGKVRGNKKAYAELADYFDKRALDKTARIGIAHADNREGTDYLLGLLRERGFTGECLEVYYEPVTGAHVGPGTVALFFYGTEK